jgi:hypothetical protein
MKETEKVKRVTNSEDYLEEKRSYRIHITDVMKWAIHATVFHLKRKGIRAHLEGYCIALTLTLTLPNTIYYFFHLTLSTIDLLANLKCCTYHRREYCRREMFGTMR